MGRGSRRVRVFVLLSSLVALEEIGFLVGALFPPVAVDGSEEVLDVLGGVGGGGCSAAAWCAAQRWRFGFEESGGSRLGLRGCHFLFCC